MKGSTVGDFILWLISLGVAATLMCVLFVFSARAQFESIVFLCGGEADTGRSRLRREVLEAIHVMWAIKNSSPKHLLSA